MPIARVITAERITDEGFAPFGRVIKAEGAHHDANQGTAHRFDRIADVANLRPQSATLNLAVFRCSPQKADPFDVRLLEKHPESTQVFIPMATSRYLVIVAEEVKDSEAPDLSTVRAFIVGGSKGVAYLPGCWHHPIIALDERLDFTCLVWEDGSASDCIVYPFRGDEIAVHII